MRQPVIVTAHSYSVNQCNDISSNSNGNDNNCIGQWLNSSAWQLADNIIANIA